MFQAQIVVELVARHEAGADTAGCRLQLALADQGAKLVGGTPELEGDFVNGERSREIHRRVYSGCGEALAAE